MAPVFPGHNVNDNLGHHLLFDCHGCRGALLADLPAVRGVLARAAATFGLTVIAERFHEYQPQGVSGVLILSESHLAVHTWPEHGFAAVILHLRRAARGGADRGSSLGAERVEVRVVERGAHHLAPQRGRPHRPFLSFKSLSRPLGAGSSASSTAKHRSSRLGLFVRCAAGRRVVGDDQGRPR